MGWRNWVELSEEEQERLEELLWEEGELKRVKKSCERGIEAVEQKIAAIREKHN